VTPTPWLIIRRDSSSISTIPHLDLAGIIPGFRAEGRRRDEHAFPRALALKCTSKLLDLGATDGVLPLLGLNVDDDEAESILLDYAVYAGIAGSTDCAPRVGQRSSVAHLHKQFQTSRSKKRGEDPFTRSSRSDASAACSCV